MNKSATEIIELLGRKLDRALFDSRKPDDERTKLVTEFVAGAKDLLARGLLVAEDLEAALQMAAMDLASGLLFVEARAKARGRDVFGPGLVG